jgi:hypothetical protein
MNASLFKPNVLPPQLSMDEYFDHMEELLRTVTPEQLAQKAWEKTGISRFAITDDPAPTAIGRQRNECPQKP